MTIQASGMDKNIPFMKWCREKKEEGRPVTNILRLLLNIKSVAKISVPKISADR